jgi:hypothetical protein
LAFLLLRFATLIGCSPAPSVTAASCSKGLRVIEGGKAIDGFALMSAAPIGADEKGVSL